MERLYLVVEKPPADPAKAVMCSDWARFLPDPTMLEVSLYFARHIYAASLRNHVVRLALEAQKGLAIRSVRRRLTDGSGDLSDSLVAAILILSVLDQVSTNIDAWRIHISGLIRLLTVRAQSTANPPAPWMLRAIPHTTMQGLITLSRHDGSLFDAIENTGIFATMFSSSACDAAYLILSNSEQLVALQRQYSRNGQLVDQDHLRALSVNESLDKAMAMNRLADAGEAFLTATALSMRIFLSAVLQTRSEDTIDTHGLALLLMDILEKPEQQLCPSLVLCSYLDSRLWQATMGALAASDAAIKTFFVSRLERIAAALALRTWRDAEMILLRFFWIPSVLSGRGSELFSEILSSSEVMGHQKVWETALPFEGTKSLQ
jgi:hypothetical protein